MNKEKLMAQLEIDEGKRARVYTDTVGKLTAGIGRNISDRDFSPDEIALMLANDVAMVARDLDRAAPWWRQMSEARQNVLANMAFNMGIGSLLTFKNTLAAMQQGRFDDAANGMLASLWARQVKGRAVRLAKIMREGDF